MTLVSESLTVRYHALSVSKHSNPTTYHVARSLDENLHTRQGPMRTFLILARYAARTVFEEQLEIVSQHGSIFWPRNLLRFLCTFADYVRVEIKLQVYETWLSMRNRFGTSS